MSNLALEPFPFRKPDLRNLVTSNVGPTDPDLSPKDILGRLVGAMEKLRQNEDPLGGADILYASTDRLEEAQKLAAAADRGIVVEHSGYTPAGWIIGLDKATSQCVMMMGGGFTRTFPKTSTRFTMMDGPK